MSNYQVWLRMMRYAKPYTRWAVTAFVGIVGSTALMIAIPTILRDVIDIGIARGDADYMLAAGLLIVGLGVIRGFMGYLARFYGERLSHHVAYDIRNETYNKVQHLSFSYHNQAHTGTLITRAISDVDEMQRYYAFGLLDGVNVIMLTVGVSIVMFVQSPLLAIIALLPLIPLAILSQRFAMEVRPRWKKVMERVQELSDHLQENVVGAQVVRAFAREDYEINKFNTKNAELYEDRLDLITRWITFLPISQFIVAMSVALVLIFGGFMEAANFGGITVGTVVAFNAYVLMLGQPLRFVGFILLLQTQAIASGQRIFEIIDEELEIKNVENATTMPTIKGHVKFEHVDFAYSDAPDQPVLRDINLEVEPGQVVALLGKTGSGKSTLINLLMRFYDATKGSVKIDNIDVRDVNIKSLRRQIGMVLQESTLFSATIAENIAYGNPDATEEEIIEVAKAANAHPFIMEFPEGYQTRIGERGVTLSGGQRQRVAIARALLIDPHILVLDDSTSSVDTKTEFEIQEALSRLMKDRTTFIIAQRLTSVQQADKIVVLEAGHIVETGTHQELLDLNGRYAEIYRLQLADQDRLKQELLTLGGLVDKNNDKRSTSEVRMEQYSNFSGD